MSDCPTPVECGPESRRGCLACDDRIAYEMDTEELNDNEASER